MYLLHLLALLVCAKAAMRNVQTPVTRAMVGGYRGVFMMPTGIFTALPAMQNIIIVLEIKWIRMADIKY